MRTINRKIVGGFIFSKDGKILLGMNRPGGVYEGQYVVPAGGIEDGETVREALNREILEETGIDISNLKVSPLPDSFGEHEKTLPNSGEEVLVRMTFYDFKIDLDKEAKDIKTSMDSDLEKIKWFDSHEINSRLVAEPTLKTLILLGFVKDSTLV